MSTIGFVGLGVMGKQMAKNLVDAGYEVIGYDRAPKPLEEFKQYGGSTGESLQEVALAGNPIILCLPDSAAVEAVLASNAGLVANLSAGDVVIDMSTISPTVTEQVTANLADHGVQTLDAPVSGGEQGAIEGTLSIMVGGEESVLEEHRDLFDILGEQITYCGDHGTGQVTKACNQIVVSNTIQAISEALVFAEKGGANLPAVIDALNGGAASCWMLENRAPSMIRGEFEPGFLATHQYKDLRIANRAGEAYGAPLPITQVTHEMYKAMVETDHGHDDNSGVIQVLEQLAGAQARVD